MRFSDVHMHHWRSEHFAGIDVPEGFSPLAEYRVGGHIAELQEVDAMQVDLVVCAQLSLTDRPDHVLDTIRGTRTAAQRGARASSENGETRVLGVVGASPDRVTDGSLEVAGVAGVRLMLGGKDPRVLDEDYALSAPDWQPLIRLLAERGMHFTTMCINKETAIKLLSLVPAEIPVGFDHLALGYEEHDPTEQGFRDLLDAARARGNVYFKGPGYRTSLEPKAVAPMVVEILRACGPESVLLGATDAPHVWLHPKTDKPMRDSFPNQKNVVEYLTELASGVLAGVQSVYPGLTADALLSENAIRAYGGQ